MSNTTVIDYSDSDGEGTVTLVANPFNKGSKYYALFDRTTINVDNLIARIQKRETGTDAMMAKHLISLFKAEILNALSRGESINMFDLGILSISAKGPVKGETPETAVLPALRAKFTCSKLTNKTVAGVKIKKIVMAATSPVLGTMTDLFTGHAGLCFTVQKPMRIEGTRLKITGNEGGIFFAPLDEAQKPVRDETRWIKVEDKQIIRNFPKSLEFFLPEALTVGIPYRIVIKTNCSGRRQKKTYEKGISPVVTVVNE